MKNSSKNSRKTGLIIGWTQVWLTSRQALHPWKNHPGLKQTWTHRNINIKGLNSEHPYLFISPFKILKVLGCAYVRVCCPCGMRSFSLWKSSEMRLLRFVVELIPHVMFSDVYVVLCYVLSQCPFGYRYQGFLVWKK